MCFLVMLVAVSDGEMNCVSRGEMKYPCVVSYFPLLQYARATRKQAVNNPWSQTLLAIRQGYPFRKERLGISEYKKQGKHYSIYPCFVSAHFLHLMDRHIGIHPEPSASPNHSRPAHDCPYPDWECKDFSY